MARIIENDPFRLIDEASNFVATMLEGLVQPALLYMPMSQLVPEARIWGRYKASKNYDQLKQDLHEWMMNIRELYDLMTAKGYRKDLGKIHAIKKQYRIPEEVYRLLLKKATGKESCGIMLNYELKQTAIMIEAYIRGEVTI